MGFEKGFLDSKIKYQKTIFYSILGIHKDIIDTAAAWSPKRQLKQLIDNRD